MQEVDNHKSYEENILATLQSILAGFNINLAEQYSMPEKHASYRPVPTMLDARVQERLREQYPAGMYQHQALALEHLLTGADLCLETSTSSGKSAVFTAYATHRLMQQRGGLVLAMYPTKGLLSDQLQKWESFATSMGITVGRIDGAVAQQQRSSVLANADVVLMTPDVVHAWLLGKSTEHLDQLRRISLVIIDEAHMYSGAFGSNMAFLMRRLLVHIPSPQVITATATISDTNAFVEALTGRSATVIGRAHEGQPSPPKHIYLADSSVKMSTEVMAGLVRELARSFDGKFIVFVDSRKSAEIVASHAHQIDRRLKRQQQTRDDGWGSDDEEADDVDHSHNLDMDESLAGTELEEAEAITGEVDRTDSAELALGIEDVVVTYRAGYGDEDREAIQQALSSGSLRGVVSTSALELGVDIGEIDLVVLLNTPPSLKSFWQRFGRAGRRNNAGECLIFDTLGTITSEGLETYLSRPAENNYIYLDNRYIQYTHVLCASVEAEDRVRAIDRWSNVGGVPQRFIEMLRNEFNETDRIDDELFTLKQLGEGEYHRTFSIRSGAEEQFTIKMAQGNYQLGTIAWSQVLREAYPGGIYYHKNSPYLVKFVSHRTNEIVVQKTSRYRSTPKSNAMVFPNYQTASEVYASESGFVIECDIQVSERVTGCTVHQGSRRKDVVYGTGEYRRQRTLSRYIRSTGVLWQFSNVIDGAEEAARLIMGTYINDAQIHSGDIALGKFHAKNTPTGGEECSGYCIYDSVNGGLRLTHKLYEHFGAIVEKALAQHAGSASPAAYAALEKLVDNMRLVRKQALQSGPLVSSQTDDEWIDVVCKGEIAMFVNGSTSEEVRILNWAYTKNGLVYTVPVEGSDAMRTVKGSAIVPLAGTSRTLRYNTETGEREEQQIEE